jgi:hypothetical protein
MILRHRQRHRAVWSLLAIVLPLLYVATLRARPPRPSPGDVPVATRGHGSPPANAARGAWHEADGTRARRISGPTEAWLEIELRGAGRPPDLLAYWIEGPVDRRAGADELTASLAEAWLLGEAPGDDLRHYRLPSAGEGTLLLYSLAHREIRAALYLPAEEG